VADYDNTNRIVLFKNDKDGNESRPDMTGTLDVEGVEYRVSVWKRESASGNKFLSGAIQLKEERAPAKPAGKQQTKRAPASAGADFDDDLPF
jgi:hypothetical protein